MKKIFIIGQEKMGWSIDSDRKSTIELFKKSDNFEVTRNILKANIIYSVWYDILIKFYFFYPLLFLKNIIKKVKIFAVITNNVEDAPEKIEKLKKLIDIWVSPNSRTHEFILRQGLKSIQIPFLVNKNIFSKLNKSKNELSSILGIDEKKLENKILIGSFQRDSLGSDLSRPKWQKNPELLIKTIKSLPKEKFLLVLAGPRRHYIINVCKKINIPYLFVGDEEYINKNRDDIFKNNLSLEKINLLYNLIDLYLVTSKSEGGPKAILEAALTKTLIFSTDVGLAPDILHEDLIFSENNLDDLKTNIANFISNKNSFDDKIDYNFHNVLEVLDEKMILSKIKYSYEN